MKPNPLRLLGSVALLLAGALSNACTPDADERSAKAQPPDVLVISVDCLRADHVGPYGSEHDATPAIDAVARDGIVFENAFAQANWTKPSVASLMTGLYVRNHGVVVGTDYFDEAGVHKVGANSFPLPDDLPLMSEAFQSAGYRTGGFIENSHIHPAMGFGRGFEVYEKAKPAARSLETWLSTLTPGEPFFAYLHVIGPHDPYDGTTHGARFAEDYRTKFGEFDSQIDWSDLYYKKKVKSFTPEDLKQARSFYAAEVNFYDQEQLAPILRWLKDNDRYDDALIVITSDHGEELFDHGGWAHGHTLYDEVIRVPLIIKLSRQSPGLEPGSRVREMVEQIDLFPTLCRLAGCEVPYDIDGLGFDALLTGDRAEDPEAFAISEFGKGVRTQVLAAAIIQGQAKAVRFYPSPVGPLLKGPRARRDMDRTELLLLDPQTDAPVDPQDSAQATRLEALLKAAAGLTPTIRHAPVDAIRHTQDDLEELRALGYVE